jgi:hypothetical protein
MTQVGLTTLREILNRHVRLFNDGARTGNFGPMTSYFVDDAEMRFEGIPVGPFRELRAIERAYSVQPPDDEIVVLNVKEEPGGNVIICEYAWSKKPKVRAGELILTSRGEKVEKLIVRYER